MPSIALNTEREQYLARKRENQQRYRAAHPGREARNKKNNQPYQDREQRRNAKRHTQLWHLHPNCSDLILIDGEADDDGHYYLFQAYSPDLGLRTLRVEPPHRLGLFQVARFLWHIQRHVRKVQGKRATFLYFAHGYDMAQQLYGSETRGELTHDQAQAIWNMRGRHWGSVRGPDFRPEYFIEKMGASVYNGRKQGYVLFHDDDLNIIGRVAWQDMFSLSAKSLVSTIEDWAKFWTPAEQAAYGPALEHVRLGKAARGRWSEAGMTPEQIETEYQLPELRLMHWYARKVIDLCLILNLAPRSLAGPAPMARALLTQYGVTAHIKPENYDSTDWQDGEVMHNWIRPAMFGGNIQLCTTGIVAGYEKYDITSAYPSWIARLPCVAHGAWRAMTRWELDNANAGIPLSHAVYDIAWKCPPDTRWPPFPVRDTHGTICYPLSGHGRYCSPEIAAFLVCHGQTAQYDIRAGWVWESTCTEAAPFAAMVGTTFAARKEYKRLGMPEGTILKLALNSVYGVLAQTSGSYRQVDEHGETVKYHTPEHGNLFAAAYITSGCRGDLMRMIASKPDAVIGTMTDAVLATEPLPLPTGDALGELERQTCTSDTACIAPGVLAHADGHNKFRGVPSTSVWYVDDTPCPSMWDAYMLARETNRTTIAAGYQAFQNPYAAGCDPAHVGAFIDARRTLDITSYVLAHKRNTARETPDGYCPPYERASVPLSMPYVRPMDRGGSHVPERDDHIET